MQLPGETLLSRLWETIAEKGVGSLLRPWQIRREGRAHTDVRREELVLIAQAERDAEEIRGGRMRLLGQRAAIAPVQNHLPVSRPITARVDDGDQNAASVADLATAAATADAIRREINVAKALLHAESQLAADSQQPPDAKVNDDWIFRWRDSASAVSAADLQHLWGQVLAGEVKSPGSYSLRTIEFLRNISQEEARSIEKLAKMAVGGFVFRDDRAVEAAGVNFSFLLDMQDLGLLAGVDAMGLEMTMPSVEQGRYVRLLLAGPLAVIVTHPDATKQAKVPIYKITPIGLQVLGLGTAEPSPEYLRVLGENLCGQGFEVHLGRYFQIDAKQVRYFSDTSLCPPAPASQGQASGELTPNEALQPTGRGA